MVKKNIKYFKISIIVMTILALLIFGTYYYQNANAKAKYFQKYDECNDKAKENPIRDAGGVKNIDELKFVINCFENKGCYESCGNSRDPIHPGINLTEIFKSTPSDSNVCEKRCYYSPEYFK